MTRNARATSVLQADLGRPFVVSLAVLLPCISAVAAYVGFRELLLAIFLLIGLAIFAVAVKGDAVSDSFLALLILCFSLSLLLSSAFRSDTLSGWDIHEEYRLFLQVLRYGKWEPTGEALYSSVISISILPSIVASVSGLDGIRVFQIGFPMLYSIVPVVIFKFYRTILSRRDAFFCVFLFMSYPTFYEEMLQLGRQEIAEVLLVTTVLVLLLAKPIKLSSALALMILTLGLVVSHYSLAYVYLGLVSFSFLMSNILRRTKPLFSAALLLMTMVVTVSWYYFVGGGIGMTSLTTRAILVANAMANDFFSQGSRPIVVLQALGAAPVLPGVLHEINRVTQYFVQMCLILGFAVFVLRKQRSMTESRILPLMAFSMALLGACVILPLFAATLKLSRIYHLALIFISPCFVFGIDGLSRLVSTVGFVGRRTLHANIGVHFPRKSHVAAAILCSYFLFVSGWTWAAAMDRPTSYVLDSARMLSSPDMDLKQLYVEDHTVLPDIAGARWLAYYRQGNRPTCSDKISRWHVLNSYGELPRQYPVLPYCSTSYSYVFMSEYNVLFGMGFSGSGDVPPVFQLSQISDRLIIKNRVYSGVAVVYD